MPNWTRPFILNDGPGYVVTPGAELVLTYVREGTRDTYQVTGTGLDPAWNGCWLVPRGSEELVWKQKQLKKWDAKQEYTYDKRLRSTLRAADANTIRLEGEITVGGKKELVVLFIAPNAVTLDDGVTKQDVLIIRSVMKSLFDMTLDQDGTGHGNPR
jgi:hypothetical protein